MGIPEYYSQVHINLFNGGKRDAAEKDPFVSKRFCVIASWNDWIVAAPSDKYIYLIQEIDSAN